MTDHLLIEKSASVLVLTLNRPQKKNALTRSMYRALGEAIDEAGRDDEVRAILIQANGDSFTAGNDLAEFAAVAAGDVGLRETMDGGNPLLRALIAARKPVVAAVQGRAVGIGVTMLLHCDLVFVAEDAILVTPFVDLALTPEAASSLLLPARIGHARAFAMIVLGEPVDGRTAVDWGLANAVAPVSELRARALAAAAAVAFRPSTAVAVTKSLMRSPEVLTAVMEEERTLFIAQLQTDEARAAISAAIGRVRPSR